MLLTKSQSCVKIVKLQIKILLVLKKKGQNTTKKSQSCVKIVKLQIKKLLVLKKKGQNTTKKSQSFVKIVKLPITTNINNFFISTNITILTPFF
jgi:hypothetical protein